MNSFSSIITRLASFFAIGVGSLVLWGWYHNISVLKWGWINGIATMKVNTALCFILLGITLGLCTTERFTRIRYHIAQISLISTLNIALLTLSEYFLAVNLGIDQLIFPDISPSSTTLYPGRMGEGTAICLVFLSTSLLLLLSKSRKKVFYEKLSQFLAISASIFALLSLLSHLFGVKPTYLLIVRISTTAPHTAITVLVICVGIFALRPQSRMIQLLTSPLAGGIMLRSLLPWAIFFPLILNWLVFQGQLWGLYDEAFSNTLQTWSLILIFSSLVGSTAFWLNKSERERLETLSALEDSSRLNRIITATHDAILIYTLEGVITHWNAGAEKMFGYSHEEMIGQSIYRLIPSEYSVEQSQLISQILQQETIDNYETVRIDKQGSWLDISLSLALLTDNHGEIMGISGIYRNITQQKQVERALAESERKFKALFNSTFQFAGLLTPDGILLEANQTALDFGGIKREDVINRPFWQAHWWTISSTTQQQLQQAIAKAAAGEFVRYEVDVLGAENQVATIDFSLKPLTDDQGKVILLIPEGRDISDYYQTKLALQESEERFRNAFDYAVIGKALVALDGHFLQVNPSLCNILGYSQAELQQLTFQELTHPDDLALDLANVERLIKGEFSFFQQEKRYFHKQGLIIWGLLSVSLVRDRQGNPLYFISQIQDITTRKETEQALRESQERLQLALEASGEGLWDWDLVTQEVYVSPQWKAMLGYDDEDLPVTVSFWESLIHPEDYPWVIERLNAHLEDSGVSYHFDYRLKTRSGEWKWIANYGKVVKRNQQGKPLRMTGTHRDISEQKQAERDRQEKEKAILANQAKSVFIAQMSHELRTPLNAILGFSQLMSRDPSLTTTQQERLEIINRSGEHLLSLINDILTLSKIEMGKVDLHLVSFDFYRMITSIEAMFKFKAESKSIQLIIRKRPNLPQYIYCDEKILRQILINLLSNAIKFTEVGTVTLQVSYIRDNQGKMNLEMVVADTGTGMSKAEIEQIFHNFVQMEAGRQSNQGNGLGLAISQKLVTLLAGKIKVSSKKGQGSIFTVTIPIQLSQIPRIKPPPLKQKVLKLAPKQLQYRILVAEDNPENRKLLVELLEFAGFAVKQASNGQEAVYMANTWHPHLIWMDIRMPVMGGITATQQIKAVKNPDSLFPIIIALTASVFEEDRLEILANGCDDFVRKPLDAEVIFQKISHYLGVHYLYENSFNGNSFTLSPTYQLTAEALKKMPQQWVESLQTAAYCLDAQTIYQLISEIPDREINTAKALQRLVENFEFEQILEIIAGNLR